MRVTRAQMKGGDLDYCDIENSFAVHMQYIDTWNSFLHRR